MRPTSQTSASSGRGAAAGLQRATHHPASAASRSKKQDSTACSVICSAASSATRRPAVHDVDPVGEVQHLGQLGRDQHHRSTLLGEILDQAIDLDLGADVDADRRLVEQEDPDRAG